MKNVTIKKARKGFSLVEMLVVIAIIGIIAAIAIPNIGSVNQASRVAAAQRNAQQIASVLNAAIAAGADSSAWTTGGLVDVAEGAADGGTDVKPSDGPFAGKSFTVGNVDDGEENGVDSLLEYDSANQTVLYDSNKTPVF